MRCTQVSTAWEGSSCRLRRTRIRATRPEATSDAVPGPPVVAHADIASIGRAPVLSMRTTGSTARGAAPVTPDYPGGIAICETLLVHPLLRARAMRTMIGLRNMPKTFVIVIWLALMVPSVARAQGSWLQKGVSGVGADLGVSRTAGNNVFLLGGGYSHRGILDVGLDVGWTAPTREDIPDLSAYVLAATLTYHPLKQTKETPLSVSVGLGYVQIFFSSDTLSENDASLSSWGTVLVGSAYRFFPVAERIGVTPKIGLAWNHTSVSGTVLDQTQTATSDLFVIHLEAELAYLDSAGHIWGVAPNLSFGPGDNPTTFGISVEFIATIPGAR